MTLAVAQGVEADGIREIERASGFDPITDTEEAAVGVAYEIGSPRGGDLLPLALAYEDVQRTRLGLEQRGLTDLADEMKRVEQSIARQVTKHLRAHPVWPWLSKYPGLGGVHVARLVAVIGDPLRFPGARCAAGHYHPRADDRREIGLPDGPCGVEQADGGRCEAPVGPPRRGTGTRALWRYLGLDVTDEGRLPRKRKGVQSHWSPRGRTACLMPGGVADQIVKLRVPKYRGVYDDAKARIQRERSVEVSCELDAMVGAALRPIEVEKRARTIAVKAFVGDLLAAMKAAA